MATNPKELVESIKSHRCFTHPIFEHWANVNPEPQVVGALFHQIQMFCAATRPGHEFPEALKKHGLDEQGRLLDEIVESEDGHGPELATMAGFIVNRAAGKPVFLNLEDQAGIEQKLKEFSDQILGSLPGYDRSTGLTVQARRAIAVFNSRKSTDLASTYKNLGVALALEIISNRHLIPGEKHCLVDSGLYSVQLEVPEMHYLLEHWGEAGAEQQHEKNAMAAVESAFSEQRYAKEVVKGANEFLDSLVALWDVLDSSLLQSGFKKSA
ncbi:hypothetical protein M1D96_14015 [Pseudomonas sp. D1-3]